MITAVRARVTELLPSCEAVAALTAGTGRSPSDLARLCANASARLQGELKLQEPPLAIAGSSLTCNGVAGLVQVAPGLELEVAPKFLGFEWAGWKEDLYTLALLSEHGQLFVREDVQAVTTRSGDLVQLVARTFVREIETHRRWPLRVYRQREWRDFEIEGEVDVEDLRLPDADGFAQTAPVFDAANPYNTEIRRAAETLHGAVRDPGLQQRLARAAASLSPADRRRRASPRVPSRHRRWQQVYELARHINGGGGASLDPGALSSPGFAVNTWRTWEQLVNLLLRLAFRGFSVHAQNTAVLGERRTGLGRRSAVLVTPDNVIEPSPLPDGGARLVADAKYRSRVGRKNAIAAGDLYESLAFALAARSEVVVLIYPDVPYASPPELGRVQAFDMVEAHGISVVAVMVDVRGIGGQGGLRRMADGLRASLPAAVGSAVGSADPTLRRR